MARLICTKSLKLNKIRHAGVVAGLRGRSREQCPWLSQDKKTAWLQGWREGYDNYTSGSFWIH